MNNFLDGESHLYADFLRGGSWGAKERCQLKGVHTDMLHVMQQRGSNVGNVALLLRASQH